MKFPRTDLAVEARDLYEAASGAAAGGVSERKGDCCGFPITEVRVETKTAEKALGKACGRYITLDLAGFVRREENAFPRAVRAVAAQLKELLPPLSPTDCVLVAGLGNRAITPDAIGPKTADHTLVTRHLVMKLPEQFGKLRPVAALSAGVLGTTGMESGELLRAVVEKLHPACVVAVDALCARENGRLCKTVQLTDSGISPGSGVGNRRAAINANALGVPVAVLGVPTVIDVASLAAGENASPGLHGLIVTPKDIDARVNDLSKVLGYGINLALQPSLTLEDVELFLS